jgi:hypothetical protein
MQCCTKLCRAVHNYTELCRACIALPTCAEPCSAMLKLCKAVPSCANCSRLCRGSAGCAGVWANAELSVVLSYARPMQSCANLCVAELCCAELCCAELCWAVLCCAVLCRAELCCASEQLRLSCAELRRAVQAVQSCELWSWTELCRAVQRLTVLRPAELLGLGGAAGPVKRREGLWLTRHKPWWAALDISPYSWFWKWCIILYLFII